MVLRIVLYASIRCQGQLFELVVHVVGQLGATQQLRLGAPVHELQSQLLELCVDAPVA